MKRLQLAVAVLIGSTVAAPSSAQHERHAAAAPAAGVVGEAPPTVPGRRTDAGRQWTRYPLIVPAMARGGERSAAVLRPVGIDAGSVQVFAADGPPERRKAEYPVGADGTRIEAVTPKIGNYHWVVAREEAEGSVRVASTAWYFGNSGAAPTAMLKESRHELEIVPEPLPREHGSYRESEKWRFLVRANGSPLPGQTVTLETEFGSRSTFVTDAAGYATVLFPRDFRPPRSGGEAEGGHGPRRAQFVLATERAGLGRRYLTAFNSTYGPDADRHRSLGWGVFFGVVGMAAATPLLRRRAAKKLEGTHHA